MKNLQLSLKKQWFEMTKSGEKTEDYREITPYWCKRLVWVHDPDINLEELCFDLSNPKNDSISDILHFYNAEFAYFTTNTMTLGYPKSTDKERILIFEHAGIEIGYGKPEWGAEPNKLYFIIKHGKRLQ